MANVTDYEVEGRGNSGSVTIWFVMEEDGEMLLKGRMGRRSLF